MKEMNSELQLQRELHVVKSLESKGLKNRRINKIYNWASFLQRE